MGSPSSSLHGKTVLVTGGTGGIGQGTARGLAQLGATIVVIGRDAARGKLAVAALRAETGNHEIHLLCADLSSQTEIHRVAGEFRQRFSQLHVLVNNVAGIFRYRQETVDGIEATFALGHLAPFLLTHLLLPVLEASAPTRIVNVTSEGHSMATMDFDDLQARRFYRGVDIYTRAKLANLMFTYELARRLQGTGITVNAVDPGGAHTRLTNATTMDMLPPLMKVLYPVVSRFAFTSVEKAAESSIYTASSPDLATVSGKYFTPKLKEARSSEKSYDQEAGRRLWQISEEMTGIHTIQKLAG